MAEPEPDLIRSTTDTRSLAFFLFFLAGGAVAAWLSDHYWYMPAVFVATYTGFLVGLRKSHSGVLSQTVTDSPYYLGFLLTQIALIFLFLHAYQKMTDVAALTKLIPKDVAIALTTTVVGLVARQILVLTDRNRHGEMDTLDLIERRTRQQQLLDGLDSTWRRFVDSTNEHLANREKALAREVDLVNTAETSLQTGVRTLEAVRGKAEREVADHAKQIAGLLDGFRTELKKIGETAVFPLQQSTNALKKEIHDFERALADFTTIIRKATPDATVAELASRIQDLRKEMVEFGETARAAHVQAAELSHRSQLQMAQLFGQTKELADQTVDAAKKTKADLEMVDNLVTDFVKVAQRSLRSLASEYGKPDPGVPQ